MRKFPSKHMFADTFYSLQTHGVITLASNLSWDRNTDWYYIETYHIDLNCHQERTPESHKDTIKARNLK